MAPLRAKSNIGARIITNDRRSSMPLVQLRREQRVAAKGTPALRLSCPKRFNGNVSRRFCIFRYALLVRSSSLTQAAETVADHTLIKAAPSFSKLTAAGFLAFLATLFIIVI